MANFKPEIRVSQFRLKVRHLGFPSSACMEQDSNYMPLSICRPPSSDSGINFVGGRKLLLDVS